MTTLNLTTNGSKITDLLHQLSTQGGTYSEASVKVAGLSQAKCATICDEIIKHFTTSIANLGSMIASIAFTFEAPLPGWPVQSEAVADEHGTGVLIATMVRDTDWEMINEHSGEHFMVFHTSDAGRNEMYTLNIRKKTGSSSSSGSD